MRNQIKSGGVIQAPKVGYYNINAIQNDGSSVSTQVWVGTEEGLSPKVAAARVLEFVARGEVPGQTWDKPICHVFIHHTATGATHHYDMSDAAHVLALKLMAA